MFRDGRIFLAHVLPHSIHNTHRSIEENIRKICHVSSYSYYIYIVM